MISKTIAAVTALFALAASMTVAVVGAAFALYFLLEPLTGRAGAAAVVAGAFALLIACVVVFVAGRSKHHHDDHHQDHHGHGDFDFVSKLFGMAKEKPILAAAGAVAAGLLAIRNPALVATILAAFIEKPKGPRR